MPVSPRKSNRRKRLSNIFTNLDNIYTSAENSPTSPMSPRFPISPTYQPSSTPASDLSQLDLPKSIRERTGGSWPVWGSIREKAPMRATFTIRMDDMYRYPLNDSVQQPDEAFMLSQECFEDIQKIMGEASKAQEEAYEAYLKESFIALIFGSNLIERVGLGLDLTVRICEKVLSGEPVPAEIHPRDPEYEAALVGLVTESGNRHSAITRSRAEVIQHALALKYITDKVVTQNQVLSEDTILETHRILCHGIPLEDGSGDPYAGQYRTVSVVAGFTAFTPAPSVQYEMKKLVQDFNADIEDSERRGFLDPYMLATKYCHKFVNIHPFVDGNGRTCRLILNAILLKYAGIVVALGEKDDERDEYLQIAAEGSMAEQAEPDEYDPPWSRLATHVLSKAAIKLEELREKL